MSKKQWFIRFVISVALLAAIGLSLRAYGNQTTVPIGYSFYDWRLSTLTPEQVREEFPRRVAKLRQEKIYFEFFEGNQKQEASFTLEQLEVDWNDQETLHEILAYEEEESLINRVITRARAVDRQPFQLALKWNEEKTRALLSEQWPDLFARKAINAKRVINEFDEIRYEPEQAVFTPDMKRLMTELAQLDTASLSTDERMTVRIPLRKEEPTVTIQDLKQQGIERKIAEFSTFYSTNSRGRAHNVEATAQVLNDTLLAPDEVFSYKNVVDQTTEQYGYRAAPVIVNGELRSGIGGGVCQISTTLYNAALLSDLEIVERRNHSLPIGYAPLGRDATFTNDGGIDFRFKNTTENNLLIRAEAKNGKLTVKLFGSSPEDKEVEIFTKTIRPGSRVNVYKRVKIGGKVVDEQLISQDTYRTETTSVASRTN